MPEMLKPDICVIGGGSGGLTVAAAAAAFGVPVVLIEGGKMGGDCLNYGCVPSKAMIAAGKTADAMRHAGAFGIKPVDPEVNFGKVHDHIRSVIASIAPNDSVERFTAIGVNVIQDHGRFTGPQRLSPAITRSRRAVSSSPPDRRPSYRRSPASTIRCLTSPTKRSSTRPESPAI
jgi:pyruvate/2-oxoglutarate dehydrogenase complex dihydrolipoamide dehydrogenase (E3) component